MFKRLLSILPAVCLATSLTRTTESPFIGKWKLVASKSRMPDEMKVQSDGGNKYTFDFGGGATETIVVDGTDQPGLAGTLLSVKASATDTWVVKRRQGSRLLINAKWKLSNDGRTLTDFFREFQPDGSTLSIDYVYQRNGEGSGFVADWQSVRETMNSPFFMQVTEIQGDGLSFVSPFGTTIAKFDDEDHTSEGRSAGRGASSSLKRLDERTVVITKKQDGKITATEDIALSLDLKTLTMTVHIAGRDKPNVLVFERG